MHLSELNIASCGVVLFSPFLSLMVLDIAPNETCKLLQDIKGQVFETTWDNKTYDNDWVQGQSFLVRVNPGTGEDDQLEP
jgi:hypothetical protein